MVRPDLMYRAKNLEDFEKLIYGELEIYIEKPLIYDGSEFLIPYESRYKILLHDEVLSIQKSANSIHR